VRRRRGAQALVIECMAVRPDLQRISEKRIVRPPSSYQRPADHLGVMGRLEDVAVALSGTTPATASLHHRGALRRVPAAAGGQRGSTFHHDPDREPTPAEMGRFLRRFRRTWRWPWMSARRSGPIDGGLA
jgi:hypothetical protein